MKFVPDPVEELEIDEDSHLLDRTFLRLIPNELDEHALEQALLLKERHGGTVTVITPDAGDVDDTLFTAKAKGADRLIKVTGEGFEDGLTNHAIASILQKEIEGLSYDLILAGTQAVDDLDGFVGALLAARLGIPYVGYVVTVTPEGGSLVVGKEYPGGLVGQVSVTPPAVIGIQAAEQPPRYVVTSLVMEAMKTASIDEAEAGEADNTGVAPVAAMAVPEAGKRAEMIEGDATQVADSLFQMLSERGIIG
jgi:electron transfer flavoprotein beta subunit